MRLINLGEKKVDVDEMTEEQLEAYRKKPVDVIAVLSRSQYQMVRTGEAELEIPSGVEMQNKAGSRTLEFYCEDRDVAESLMDGLDSSGIVWEEDNSQEISLTDLDDLNNPEI